MIIKNAYVDPQVKKVIDLYRGILRPDFYSMPIKRQLEVQSDLLAQAHKNGDDSVCFQIASWHPGLVGKSDDQILDRVFGIEDAKATIAREHGYRDWSEVEANAERHSNVDFEHAVDAMLAGDLVLLQEHVRRAPALTRDRSRYGHAAALLHYASTNGVESYRQFVPLNLAQIVEFLLESGSDATGKANIYGGSTFLALFDSSKHPYEAKVHRAVVAVFKQHASRFGG